MLPQPKWTVPEVGYERLKTFSVKEVFTFHRYKDKKKRINQPPRPRHGVATPPSKGGETFSNLIIYNPTLRLTAMPLTPFN